MELRKKENSLATQHPELIKEWDYEKNGTISPDSLAAGSSKIFYWKCVDGHSWKATVSRRTSGSRCPYCTGQKVMPGFNDLLTLNPELSSEWNYIQNGALLPQNVRPGIHKKVWWKCTECGHEWLAEIKSRVSGRGCPLCSAEKRKDSKSIPNKGKSLAGRYPQFVAEWHPTKNAPLSAFDVHPGSHRSVWWKRSQCGHEFQRNLAAHIQSGK